MTTREQLNVFEYLNYRLYLQDYIRLHYLDKGLSYRAFSKRCEISSPNYFQQVISGQKNMSVPMAEKIASLLKFPKGPAEYLVTLVRLDGTEDPDKRFAILGTLKGFAARKKNKAVMDESFHSSWINQVIWGLAHTGDFNPDPAAIQKAIRTSTTIEEIEHSLQFLKSKGYLSLDPDLGRLVPRNVTIQTPNDLRNFDLQRNHNRFLQLAQLRLNDALSDREFQGLSIPISRAQLVLAKEKMREFVQNLNESLGEPLGESEIVVRLQLAAFVVADPKR